MPGHMDFDNETTKSCKSTVSAFNFSTHNFLCKNVKCVS